MNDKYLNRIKIELDKAGRSQLWLSQQIGLSTNTISSFCRNESQPKLDAIYQIAEVLKIDVIKLLVPNDYISKIKRLTTPMGESEAKLLNALVWGMLKKNGTVTNGYFYYNNCRDHFPTNLASDILSEKMFNALAEILVHDGIARISNTGALEFTPRGLYLAYDFRDNAQESTKHIGYEARWNQFMHFLENTSY